MSSTTLPRYADKFTPEYQSALCPQCGKYAQLSARYCDLCGHSLLNPLVVVDDVLDNLRFGKLLAFAFKVTAAFFVAAIPFAIVLAILMAIVEHS